MGMQAELELLGVSAQSSRIRHFVSEAARSSRPVVLLGEPGVGKELTARRIHGESDRANEPFLIVDCSLYYDRELKREIFGYRGFGPAAKERKGLLEFTSRGTCYLSRIEELSPALQERLLEFLRSGAFQRLGDGRQIASDARLIVSSDKNLRGFVEGGLFDSELFERLQGHVIDVPPLRERSGDIPVLVERLVGEWTHQRDDRRPPDFTQQAVEALECYPWPGNLDELRAEIERILERGLDRVATEHLSLEICGYWIGKSGDPDVRKVLEELDGFIREFKVLSRLEAEFGDVLMQLDGWDEAFRAVPRQLGEHLL